MARSRWDKCRSAQHFILLTCYRIVWHSCGSMRLIWTHMQPVRWCPNKILRTLRYCHGSKHHTECRLQFVYKKLRNCFAWTVSLAVASTGWQPGQAVYSCMCVITHTVSGSVGEGTYCFSVCIASTVSVNCCSQVRFANDHAGKLGHTFVRLQFCMAAGVENEGLVTGQQRWCVSSA